MLAVAWVAAVCLHQFGVCLPHYSKPSSALTALCIISLVFELFTCYALFAAVFSDPGILPRHSSTYRMRTTQTPETQTDNGSAEAILHNVDTETGPLQLEARRDTDTDTSTRNTFTTLPMSSGIVSRVVTGVIPHSLPQTEMGETKTTDIGTVVNDGVITIECTDEKEESGDQTDARLEAVLQSQNTDIKPAKTAIILLDCESSQESDESKNEAFERQPTAELLSENGLWFDSLRAEGFKYCGTCKLVRDLRFGPVHHCGQCDHCVFGFDHHCGVLNACIAEGNHRAFVALLLFSCVSAVFGFITSAMHLESVLSSTNDLPPENGTAVVWYVLFSVSGLIMICCICNCGGNAFMRTLRIVGSLVFCLALLSVATLAMASRSNATLLFAVMCMVMAPPLSVSTWALAVFHMCAAAKGQNTKALIREKRAQNAQLQADATDTAKRVRWFDAFGLLLQNKQGTFAQWTQFWFRPRPKFVDFTQTVQIYTKTD